ncbi:MAG: C40 family peptidase [Treponema sp.]|nr:C40 family peptidase [Treponema sp.]
MRSFITVFFVYLAAACFCAGLYASPLEGGYSLAPRANASDEEKAQAYMNARRRVIEAANKYIGVPYVYGGMTSAGLDCSGFICLSFQDALGVSLPRSAAGLYSWTVRVALENAQPGDFLFFRTSNTSSITHVGLYLGGGRFMHAASAGPQTGVIISGMDEAYYINAFAGAGRAFPAAPSNFSANLTSVNASTPITSSNNSRPSSTESRNNTGTSNPVNITPSVSGSSNGRLLVNVSVAPVWNGFLRGGELFRGFTSHFGIFADTYSLGSRNVFGLETRPEYDGALRVFRLPVTLSWGRDVKFRVFIGPVFSFGDAAADGEQLKSGKVNMLGVIGVTAAPFAFNSAIGEFAPYADVLWQTNLGRSENYKLISDFSAGFKFSTGVRWLLQVK